MHDLKAVLAELKQLVILQLQLCWFFLRCGSDRAEFKLKELVILQLKLWRSFARWFRCVGLSLLNFTTAGVLWVVWRALFLDRINAWAERHLAEQAEKRKRVRAGRGPLPQSRDRHGDGPRA